MSATTRSAARSTQQWNAILKPKQWLRLTNRLDEIENPEVRTAPSKAALPDGPREGRAKGSGGTSGED